MRKTNVLTMLVVLLGILGSWVEAWGALLENDWVTDGAVLAIFHDGPTTYIGGTFSRIGPNTGSGVLIGTGTALLTGSFPRVDGMVNVAVSDGLGGFYIGGEFTAVGGVPRNSIAHIKWNNTVDDLWDPNPTAGQGTPKVNALAVSNGVVYVGGWFFSIGGKDRNYIAALDANGKATAWDPNSSYEVFSLAVSGDVVYAGGRFISIGGKDRKNIAALNSDGKATDWAPDANKEVLTISVSGDVVYAGGYFTTIGGQNRRSLAALDVSGKATAWNPDPNHYVYTLV